MDQYDTTTSTPRSNARRNERDARTLNSPERRRTPQVPQLPPPVQPFQLPPAPIIGPIQFVDPFQNNYVPPPPPAIQHFMKHVFNVDFWRMIMNGDNVYKRRVIWQQDGNYGISLQHFFATAHPQILYVYGWIFVTKSVMICGTDSRHRTFAIILLLRTSMISASS
jgi:hypothetical protein